MIIFLLFFFIFSFFFQFNKKFFILNKTIIIVIAVTIEEELMQKIYFMYILYSIYEYNAYIAINCVFKVHILPILQINAFIFSVRPLTLYVFYNICLIYGYVNIFIDIYSIYLYIIDCT